MSDKLEIYGVVPSQPTRAVMWLCRMKGLPYTLTKVSPGWSRKKRKQFIDEINPTGRIPGIRDVTGFTLYESAAILTYLCTKHKWDDLYPSRDLERRALIDQYLNWHHENIRKVTFGYIVYLMRADVDPKKWNIQSVRTERKLAGFGLTVLEKDWLRKHKYIVDDELSVADLLCYEEVVQLRWWNCIDQFATKYPNINAWLDRMSKLPFHEEMHTVLDKLKPFLTKRQNAMKDFISKL